MPASALRFAALIVMLGCASGPPVPVAGRGGVYGEIRLVPREGLGAGGAGAYGDRRLRDVTLVDYSRPGYAVIYARGPATGGRIELAIVEGAVTTRIEPAHAAVGAGGVIAVSNQARHSRIVSVPTLGLVQKLAPGESLRLEADGEGALGIFLLDEPGATSLVFVSPGPFAEAGPTGRYALVDLAPGPTRLEVWHPRFPPAARDVELAADRSIHLDFELSAGNAEDANAAP